MYVGLQYAVTEPDFVVYVRVLYVHNSTYSKGKEIVNILLNDAYRTSGTALLRKHCTPCTMHSFNFKVKDWFLYGSPNKNCHSNLWFFKELFENVKLTWRFAKIKKIIMPQNQSWPCANLYRWCNRQRDNVLNILAH